MNDSFVSESVLGYYSKKICENRAGSFNKRDLCMIIYRNSKNDEALKKANDAIEVYMANKFIESEYQEKDPVLFIITEKGEKYFAEKISALSEDEKKTLDNIVKEYYEYVQERDSFYALIDRNRMKESH